MGMINNLPGRKEGTLWTDPGSFPFGYQTIEIMDPRNLDFPQNSHAGSLVSLERMSHSSGSLSDYFAEET